MTGYVRTNREGEVAVVTLCNGERLNPLSVDMQKALLEELNCLAAAGDAGALLLRSEGRAFSVGADLSSMNYDPRDTRTLGDTVHRWMGELTNQIVLTLQAFPCPVVCAVQGPCAGAGVGLALSADIVVAARSAYFYLPFVSRLGIVPDMGTTWFYARLLGRARATALTLLGDRLPAEQAAAWGLIWAAVDDADLQRQALDTARRLAKLPSHATRETRAVYEEAASNTLEGQLEYERGRQRELIDLPTFAEGVRAFLEKREPDFRGI